MRSESLYSMERRCWRCGNPNCEVHHIYGGTGRRDISTREGCWVYLCRPHHQGKNGVHGNQELMDFFRQDCQRRWERREGVTGHEAFIATFGENFLWKEDE